MPATLFQIDEREAAPDALIPELERQLTSTSDALRYMLAGNATFTLRSAKTQKRFTYKVSKMKPSPRFGDNEGKFWVSLLYGPNNEADFVYMGILNMNAKFGYEFTNTRNSLTSLTASELMEVRRSKSQEAFEWTIKHLRTQPFLNPDLEIWHSGRCGRCGKKLTVPESIERGIGPDCASKM